MNDAVSAAAAITPLRVSAPVAASLTVPIRGEAPLALTQLPIGQTVQAVALSSPDSGLLQLKSDVGTFNLRLAIPIPEGTVLTLQTAGGQIPQMRIVMVDGRPAAQALAQIAGGGGSAGAAAGGGAATVNAPAAGAAQNVVVPNVSTLQGGISAVVLRGADSGVAGMSTSNPGALPVGTTVTLRIVEISPLTTAAGSVSASSAGSAAGGAIAPLAVPSVATLPATASGLTPLSGLVVNHSPTGQPLVQTPLGLLSLSTTTQVPQGATMLLEMVGTPSPPPVASSSMLPPPPLPGWQGLADSFNALRLADPASAQAFLNALPSAGEKMAPALAGMAAAIRAGSVEGVLGTALMQRLDKLSGGERLGRDLKRDISEMRSSLERPTGPGGEWRALTLPFNSGHTIEPIRLYIRPPPPEDEDEDKKKGGKEEGTRFVVDVTLSSLGPLQLDGLIQRKNKQFNLIIRTHVDLPENMRQDIAAIFAQSCRELNMTGGTQFQKTSAFFEVQRSAPPSQHGILA